MSQNHSTLQRIISIIVVIKILIRAAVRESGEERNYQYLQIHSDLICHLKLAERELTGENNPEYVSLMALHSCYSADKCQLAIGLLSTAAAAAGESDDDSAGSE